MSMTTCLDESLIEVSAVFFGNESRGFNVSAIIFFDASESIGCFGIVSFTVKDFRNLVLHGLLASKGNVINGNKQKKIPAGFIFAKTFKQFSIQ